MLCADFHLQTACYQRSVLLPLDPSEAQNARGIGSTASPAISGTLHGW